MPKQRGARATKANKGQPELDFGEVSEKQRQFLEAKSFYVCYGGARGGGKSHIIRIKAVGLALRFPGIRISMIRCHYPELEENLIKPILKWVPQEMFRYNGTTHLMTFSNGSEIKFGHWDGAAAENEYQGIQYDVIFIDEATQIDERSFRYLSTCIRGNDPNMPKRMYLTCNPGGVGHRWVKRLFISKNYITNDPDPEANENPDDYTFIPALVDDNPWLTAASPKYKQQLAALPEDLKMAHRYGDWDALSGSYFKNFTTYRHIVEPFKIPDHWKRYRSFDYGFDMFAVCWWAVDEDGRSWCYRYAEQNRLVVKDAARRLKELTPENEKTEATYAPPDLWAKSKDTGKELAGIFLEEGVDIVKASNNRVHGHTIMKDMMQDGELKDPYVMRQFGENVPDTLPMLMFFKGVTQRCTDDICDIQADENNPEDCAKIPHAVTHSVDAVRYYCISRVMSAEAPAADVKRPAFDEEMPEEDYDDFMCGGEAINEYVDYY